MKRTNRLLLLATAASLLVVANASAYRAVYNGSFIENGEYVFTVSEDRQLNDEITWLAGPAAGPTKNVCVLDSIGTDAFWFSVLWTPYQARYPGQVVVIRILARPVTEALLEANACEVAVVSNGWHGPPAEVPGAFPGGGDWVYRQSEGDEILSWLQNRDAGLLLTAGSFGQFAKSGPDSNYATFADMIGVESLLGGGPGCPRAFPWSRNTGCYPATDVASQHVINDPGHPIVTNPIGVPGVYGVSFTTARAVWMNTTTATRVGTVTGFTGEQSLTTAFEDQSGIEVTELTCIDYPFKGHPTACWVTAQNVGGADVDLSAGSLAMTGNSEAWARETLQFGMDDTNGTPGLDPGGFARWTTVLTLPLGPPDATYAITAKVCSGAVCGSLSKPLTSDSCKHNTTDPGDQIEEYRHFQKALVFIRTAWRNGDMRVGEALDLVRTQTDQGYKDAHTLVSNTSPGPGNYNLELIHENLDEGNCQFGVTGDWLKDL